MAKKNTANYRLYFVLLIFLMVSLFAYVYENIYVIKLGYQLQQKNEIYFKYKLENDVLSMKYNEFTSLERLDTIARQKLGLRFPTKDEVILIRYSTIKTKKYISKL
ncbi:MAG: hypothetical protein ABII27_04555 [bacterium]